MFAVYRYMRSNRRLFFIILLSLFLIGVGPLVFYGGLTYRYFRDYVESQVVTTQLDRLSQTQSYLTAVLAEVEAGSVELVLNIRLLDVGAINRESVGSVEIAMMTRRVQDLLLNLRKKSAPGAVTAPRSSEPRMNTGYGW